MARRRPAFTGCGFGQAFLKLKIFLKTIVYNDDINSACGEQLDRQEERFVK
jgi:hypothetical protein